MKKIVTLVLLSLFAAGPAMSEPNPDDKVRFYNFNDILINGKVKRPQVLYTNARQKVEFERLVRLRKDFLLKALETKRDPSLR
tara:strand:+ start:757 stop:1005 length:249 start_codon:yes stop_codon:yes gene_type:complete